MPDFLLVLGFPLGMKGRFFFFRFFHEDLFALPASNLVVIMN